MTHRTLQTIDSNRMKTFEINSNIVQSIQHCVALLVQFYVYIERKQDKYVKHRKHAIKKYITFLTW